ncbi:MAG: molybdopterin-binding oxidoreductase, partial [Geobacter sp.]
MPKMTRRNFLWVTGGTGAALATDQPRKLINKLIPQVVPAENKNIKPGEWALFATTCRECPAGCGLHLWHRDGRVTKAEGNPLHPVNGGGLCPRGQSSLQGLYDPDRVQEVLFRGKGAKVQKRSWDEALGVIGGKLAAGGKVALLSSLQTGALAEVMKSFTGAFGSNRLLFYEPFNYEPLKIAHREVFGLPSVPSYNIEQCNFVISFAADFLETWISPVSYAAQFAKMHAYQGRGAMNRMVYVGPRLSMTAANADDFVQVPPGYERLMALWMLKMIIDKGWGKNDLSSIRPDIERALGAGPIPGVPEEKLEQLARSFASAGASVALA